MATDWNTPLGELGIPLKTGEPMNRHTTFRIGGPAEYYACPRNPEEAAALAAACRRQGIVVFPNTSPPAGEGRGVGGGVG